MIIAREKNERERERAEKKNGERGMWEVSSKKKRIYTKIRQE